MTTNLPSDASAAPDGSTDPVADRAPRTRRFSTRLKVTAAALLAAAGIGGVVAVGSAAAQPTASSSGTTTDAGLAESRPGGGFGGGRGGLGGGQMLHGELVVAVPDESTEDTTDTTVQTIRVQTGEVTAIDGSSVTVESTDGFSATYTLGADLDVTDVAVGDTVSVRAEVDGDAVTAVRVHEKGTGSGRDGTGELPDGAPPAPGAPGESGQSPTTESGDSTSESEGATTESAPTSETTG